MGSRSGRNATYSHSKHPANFVCTVRSELPDPVDVTAREIWLRGAEVYTGSLPTDATGFDLGLEDVNGTTIWVSSDGIGGLLRPFDRRADDLAAFPRDFSKTMLKTMRFPVGCFAVQSEELDLQAIRAILIGVIVRTADRWRSTIYRL